MSDNRMDDLKTVEEMAESLRVPKSWIYSRTRETGPDAMPRLRVGKYLRFNSTEVFKWLDKQQKA